MEGKRSCLNCKHQLEESALFCPNCGQKVDNNNLRLGVVFREFSENYLSLDTRIGRSILPFLFKPGQLTKEFLLGRRKSFANPFRLYIIMSLLFFSLVGILLNKRIDAQANNKQVAEETAIEALNNNADAVNFNIPEQVKADLVKQIDTLRVLDSLGLLNDTVIRNEYLKNLISTSISRNEHDSLTPDQKKGAIVRLNNNKNSGFNFNTKKFAKVAKYRFNRNYTDQELLDTLFPEKFDSRFRHFLAFQSMRLYRADSKVATKFILGNYSLSMFLLIPMFAILLRLMFRKNKIPYVGHLIHSLQLHTFTFFIYSVALGAILLFEPQEAYAALLLLLFFLISIVYILISFKRVYKRGVISTFFRWLFVGMFYYFLWFVVLTLDLIASFLLY